MGDDEQVQLYGSLRAVIGVGMLLFPTLVLRTWLGKDAARTAPARALGRLLGIRELVVGAGTIVASSKGSDRKPWVVAGVACDAVDALVSVGAMRGIPARGRVMAFVAAGSAAVAGGMLASRLPE